MTWKIGMPNLGHTMEEGKVSEWLKSVGEAVAKGEVIAVVESDKASFDVESPAEGFLTHIHVEAGNTVAVGTAIGQVAAQIESSVKTEINAALTPRKDKRISASPVAKKLAQELGVDLAWLRASSADGMISKSDVQMYAEQHIQKSMAPSTTEANDKLRRAISNAVTHAWQTIPHVALQSHAKVDALCHPDASNLTASIVRACALALVKHPNLNGWLLDGVFKPSQGSNMGISVSVPSGVVNAVIPHAENQSISELSHQIKNLASHAKSNQLTGKDITGAGFTVSNLGRWGVDSFAPIIDAPQVAILGVGRIQNVAVETASGGLAFEKHLGLTLVFDHRANDGVEAAQLIQSIVAFLETPSLMDMTA
jgi:pyruvate dehydrogenase E2 component (dihydrolipoamide acetyltransferase)